MSDTDEPTVRPIDREVGTTPDSDHRLSAPAHADAAVRDLAVGARIDTEHATAEIRYDETRETVVGATRAVRGRSSGEEEYRIASLMLKLAATGDSTAEVTVLLDQEDAAEVRELADALATVADHLEAGANE